MTTTKTMTKKDHYYEHTATRLIAGKGWMIPPPPKPWCDIHLLSTVIQMFTNVIFVTLPSLRRILTCFSPQEFCYSCRGPWVLLVLWFALYTVGTYMHIDWYWDTALCVCDIIVCALNITKDCGADQLDHEEDPVVCAVVLNQHQQYIYIEYGTNRQHDITSTCIEYATNHHQQYMDMPQTITMTTLQRLF